MKGYEKPKWLVDMPKAELHCHLGGSMRLKTMLEIASDNGIELNARDEEELSHLVLYKETTRQKSRLFFIGHNLLMDFRWVQKTVCLT